MKPLAISVTVVALTLVATSLPFLPGRYDALAVPLSWISREYLFYNPADSQVMASHDADLLRRTAAELPQYRGYHSARRLARPHWSVLSLIWLRVPCERTIYNLLTPL